MKKNLLLFAVLVVGGLCCVAHADDYLMPQWGYETRSVSKDAPVTFYDFMGEDDIPSSSSSNSYSTVVFTPAEEGYSISVNFEYVDVKDDGAGWVSYLDVFDGVFDKSLVNGGEYPSSVSGNTTPFKDYATPVKHFENGNFQNESFVSGSATGALSVCFHYRYAAKSRGWKATVTAVKLEDMTVNSAKGDNSDVDAQVWADKKNVEVAGFIITTEGYSSPDKLQSITFTCSNAAVVNPLDVRLYAGMAASVSSLAKIEGVITENAGVYTYTLTTPYAFGNGDNKFCIGADILSSAPFNAEAEINVTGVETVGGFTDYTPATAAKLTVQPMYIMAADATFTINEQANFYDEGGPDGKVIKGFDGKAVFAPATEGKKVVLTFNTIDVFYTDYAAGSTGYVDYVKVYNGDSTADADLLWEISQATASSTSDIVIRSTAPDGKLTITHKCNVSYDSNLKDGWTATVNEFTPQAMVVGSMSDSKVTANVTAGTKGVQIASIYLNTVNTEPALSVKSLAFNTNGTNEQISKIYLYYTKDNKFSTANLVAEADVLADKVILNVGSETPFREGDNYLWIAADIEAAAVNGQKADVLFEKLVFTNDSEQTSFVNAKGGLTVDNIAIQACGTQTFAIQETWQYTHTVASEYSSKYAAEDCDQTVVFKPMHSGNVIQIDYADFDVYYSSSSYSGVRAKYVVYAGEGTSGEKLWELDGNGKKPGQIRSTSADGALTIVFNPKTSSSYYTGNGWHASVTEYTLHDMTISSVAVEQASSELVKLGENKARLLNITLNTEGTLSPIKIHSATVNLKGTENNISKVYLLDANGDELSSADAAETVTLTLNSDVELSEGANGFVVAVDVKDEAVIDEFVDAKLTTVNVGSDIQIENGDPDGSRIIKNVMNLAAGDNGTVTIGENSLVLYDDGGANGKYTSKFEGYVTFKPEDEGYAIELIVNNYGLSNGAVVSIYSGTAHEGEADAVVEYNYSAPEKYKGLSVISAAQDGSLTVYFKDGGYTVNDGFEFEIRRHLLTNLSIDDITVASIAPAMQTVGAKDVKMLQIAVTVSGDRTPLAIDAISLSAGEHTSATKIFYTDKISTFSDLNEFTTPYTVSERGVYYFWITADADPDASDNDVMTVSVDNVKSADLDIVPTVSETAVTKLAHGMKGGYTIGSNAEADFKTVKAAVEALGVLGIEGNVVFSIASGTYNEKVTLSPVLGTSADATVTFQSETGNAADVVFQNDDTSDTEGVWTLDGADYITLKQMTVQTEKTGYASNVVLKNQSEHITIDGCVLKTSVSGQATSQNNHLVRLISTDEDNKENNHFTLENSTLQGGYVGVDLAQGSYATHPNKHDIIIRNNTFVNQEKQMVYGVMINNLAIEGNTMTNKSFSQSDFRAIDIRTKIEGTIDIVANKIVLEGSNYASAIYIAPSSATNIPDGTVVNIINNAVSVTAATTSLSSAIYFKWMREVNMYYNTFLVNSPGTNSAPIAVYNAANMTLAATNNIMQNSSDGTGLVAFYASAVFAKGAYKSNTFFALSGKFSNQADTFEDWENLENITSENNHYEQVVFASNELLTPKQKGGLVSATPIPTITTDITGKERAITPTIGAYEYDEDSFRIPVLAEGYPKAANVKGIDADVVVKADNIGTAYVLVLTSDTDAPTVDAVISNGEVLTLSKNVEVSVAIKNLSEETAYKAYVVTESPMGERAADVAASDEFITQWTLRPVELNAIPTQTVDMGSDVAMTVTLVHEYEQAKPYVYSWRTAFSNEEIGTEATLNANVSNSTEYVCSVTDKFGQSALVSAHVLVTKSADVATFEEYELAEGEHKMVDDAWIDNTETNLYSGTFAFANTPNKSWNAYSGYVISADHSSEATGDYNIDQFRSAAGGSYEGDNFAVAYYSAPSDWFAGYNDPITFTNSSEPQAVTGFYVTNSAYTLDAILNGDYANGPFSQGDYYRLTITGYNGSDKTNDVVFYLADYRSEDATEHFAIDTWEWVDLSELGAVTRIEFNLFTTKSDSYGFTTPTYFCLDNFGGEAPIPTSVSENEGNVQGAYKIMENGIIYIVRPDGVRYDLFGRRVK